MSNYEVGVRQIKHASLVLMINTFLVLKAENIARRKTEENEMLLNQIEELRKNRESETEAKTKDKEEEEEIPDETPEKKRLNIEMRYITNEVIEEEDEEEEKENKETDDSINIKNREREENDDQTDGETKEIEKKTDEDSDQNVAEESTGYYLIQKIIGRHKPLFYSNI